MRIATGARAVRRGCVEARDPVWALGLALSLLAAALAPRAGNGLAANRDAGSDPLRAVPRRAATPAPDLAAATARELRGVPGLGERRALALVDARWRRARGDPPLYLGDVPGVGPASEAAVAAWMASWAP